MAKKKRSNIAAFTRSVARRKKSNPESKSSAFFSGVAEDATHVVLPGVAAYAVARLSGRIAYKIARKRSEKFAKHAGAIAPAVTALATYAASTTVEALEDYRTPLMVGTGVAAVQALAQAYIPQYGWIVNDYHLNDAVPKALPAAPSAPALPEAHPAMPSKQVSVPDSDASGMEDLSDIADGLGDDDDFLDQLEEQANGKVLRFP